MFSLAWTAPASLRPRCQTSSPARYRVPRWRSLYSTLAAQRVADLPGGAKAFGVQVPAHLQRRGGEEADRAKQHPGVLVGDAPLVKGRVIIVLFPLVQRLGGLAPAAVAFQRRYWVTCLSLAQLLYIISLSSMESRRRTSRSVSSSCVPQCFMLSPYFLWKMPRRMPSPMLQSLASCAR